jgi:hypothetical protein
MTGFMDAATSLTSGELCRRFALMNADQGLVGTLGNRKKIKSTMEFDDQDRGPK